MAKKRRSPVAPPADPMHRALERGDHLDAGRLARAILADPEAGEARRAEAGAVLQALHVGGFALASLFGGLLVWAVAFALGVLARN